VDDFEAFFAITLAVTVAANISGYASRTDRWLVVGDGCSGGPSRVILLKMEARRGTIVWVGCGVADRK
jgi:hypothetical protein